MQDVGESAERAQAGGGTTPVLVVDDDPHVRQMIRWVLEDAGLPVETAADGRQALERARRRRPALVILDLSLPHLDGHAVADELRRAYGGTVPILVITADDAGAAKARRAGAYAYLHKPFNVEELASAVRSGLAAT